MNHPLEPQKVFEFFFELCKIPHGSGNTKAIADYCLEFARKRGLPSYRDDCGNVMIFKQASAGHEESAPVILQGHLDMVCEKRPDCPKNMEREGIDVLCDGEYLYADGTTLGGDDGVAVAYILAILDDDSIAHPPLEALFTVDEEIGLDGARGLDASPLKGKRLVNLDSEEEGVLTVSCAGGVRVACELPVSRRKARPGFCGKILSVSGLSGGHSGVDIGKGNRNAAVLLGEFLYEVSRRMPVSIADFASGGRLNVIPPTARAHICLEASRTGELLEILADFNAALRTSCAHTEPEAHLELKDAPMPEEYLDEASASALISALLLSPNGVSAISADIPFLVQTSSNLGAVSVEEKSLRLGFMVRSNTAGGMADSLRRIKCLMDQLGGRVEESDAYPPWEYNPQSPLRETMVEIYEKIYGEKPRICAIHAGLECGILAQKIQGADMVSIGPNLKNVHTPDERLEIRSVQRCWEYLLRILESL